MIKKGEKILMLYLENNFPELTRSVRSRFGWTVEDELSSELCSSRSSELSESLNSGRKEPNPLIGKLISDPTSSILCDKKVKKNVKYGNL